MRSILYQSDGVHSVSLLASERVTLQKCVTTFHPSFTSLTFQIRTPEALSSSAESFFSRITHLIMKRPTYHRYLWELCIDKLVKVEFSVLEEVQVAAAATAHAEGYMLTCLANEKTKIANNYLVVVRRSVHEKS